MNIREGQLRDIPTLITLDRASYGVYGADANYFSQKFDSPNTKIVVAESGETVKGFVVFNVMEPKSSLENFSDLQCTTPMNEKWAHIIAFTTETNFKDFQADSRLLQAAELEARKLGCALLCVPLSIDHPYRKNDVFGFWKQNGYHNVGTIKWIASPAETIDCYFYQKHAYT